MNTNISKTALIYNPFNNTVVDYSGCEYKTNFIHNNSMSFDEVDKLLRNFLLQQFNITDDDKFNAQNMMIKIRDFKINQLLSE